MGHCFASIYGRVSESNRRNINFVFTKYDKFTLVCIKAISPVPVSGRACVSGAGSILGRVIPKNFKMVVNGFLFLALRVVGFAL